MNLESDRQSPIIRVSDLSEVWLERHPVWTWDEGSLFEDEDGVRPVEAADALNGGFSTVFVRSTFVTASGRRLRGSVSFDVDRREVYSIDICIEDQHFGFNLQLKDMVPDMIERLRAAIHAADEAVFPIEYSADICLEDGRLLAGEFTPTA